VREGRVIRGWIGVEPRDLPADLAASLGLEKVTGVLITGVLQGGPAALAGVRPGDVVTGVGPRPVQTTADLLKAVAALKPQTVAALSLVRNGQRVNVDVKVGQRPPADTSGPAR
jgi:S1-C subfamily serine protease